MDETRLADKVGEKIQLTLYYKRDKSGGICVRVKRSATEDFYPSPRDLASGPTFASVKDARENAIFGVRASLAIPTPEGDALIMPSKRDLAIAEVWDISSEFMSGLLPQRIPSDFVLRIGFSAHHSYGESDWEVFLTPSGIHSGRTRKWRADGVPKFKERMGATTDSRMLNHLKLIEESAAYAQTWPPAHLSQSDFAGLYDLIRREHFMSLP